MRFIVLSHTRVYHLSHMFSLDENQFILLEMQFKDRFRGLGISFMGNICAFFSSITQKDLADIRQQGE